MDRSILNGVRNVCPGQRCIRFVSVLSDVFPIVLLQPLRGQKTSRSSAAFLAFAAVSRTVFCCPSTVYSACYPLFFAAKLRKDRIQRKEYIVVIIEAPEKWKPQILLGISGRSFPQTACGKFPEKWKAFSTREKWKVCGVENKSLWKKSWKTCRTRNTASTSCGKHIPQLSTTDSTSPLLQLLNAADTAGTFSAHGFSTDC